MWQDYVNAANMDEAVRILNEKGERVRIIAGATDLILEMERGQRKGIETLVDITRAPGLDQISLDGEGWFHLGPMVTYAHVLASEPLRRLALPLVQAAAQVGSPQIRNRGTIAGNLITASPANDSIPPLLALNAEVVLKSSKGERVVALKNFFTGVRRTELHPDELMREIRFPAMSDHQHGAFLKVALRQAQAISVVNAAAVITMQQGVIVSAQITLGSVAPTVIHSHAAEDFLVGKTITPDCIREAAQLAAEEARPISDIRGSATYRFEMVRVACERVLEQAVGLRAAMSPPDQPVLLWGRVPAVSASPVASHIDPTQPIETTINGKKMVFNSGHGKSLLRLLREEAGLTGTKEGCSEGECGACTVYLDGKAVMSCLVAAPRAHHAQIVTIEGMASQDGLHPLQQTFIEAGAVQCGYCTPGLIMSGAKLLEEKPHPSPEEIRTAITGNLCRCTGYYKIIQAIEMAANQGGS